MQTRFTFKFSKDDSTLFAVMNVSGTDMYYVENFGVYLFNYYNLSGEENLEALLSEFPEDIFNFFFNVLEQSALENRVLDTLKLKKLEEAMLELGVIQLSFYLDRYYFLDRLDKFKDFLKSNSITAL